MQANSVTDHGFSVRQEAQEVFYMVRKVFLVAARDDWTAHAVFVFRHQHGFSVIMLKRLVKTLEFCCLFSMVRLGR